MTFWEHLDVLRGSIIKMLVVSVAAAIVAFCLKDALFAIVLAPSRAGFVTYRLLGVEPFTIHLVNIGLAEQFMVHLKTAFYAGIVVAAPFILYLLYRFIAPALYEGERHYALRIIAYGYAMFVLGLLANYFLIFPLTVRFLATYSVSDTVGNMLSLQSYMDTLLMMTLVFGIVFELPVVSWLLARMGALRAEWMTRFRRHAIVAILIVAAVITPTSDIFTLCVVALPIWLLYELSIIVVRHAGQPPS